MIQHLKFNVRRIASAIILTFLIVNPVSASSWGRLLDEFAGTGKGAKTAPRVADDAVRVLPESAMLAEAAGREARHLGIAAGNKAAKRRLLLTNLQKQAGDPSVLSFVEDLPDADLDLALVYLRGGRRLQEAVPDVAVRARLAQNGGASALASLGLRDGVLVDDFIKLDALTASGKMPVQVSGKSTLSRLGELLGDGSDRFASFYSRYIRGNEGKWAAGGALSWWLVDPDSFQDVTGRMTQAGMQKLTELAGHTVASALAGVAEGGKEAGRVIVDKTIKGYFEGEHLWAAWLALLIFLYAAGLLLPATRRLFLKPLRIFLKSSSSK